MQKYMIINLLNIVHLELILQSLIVIVIISVIKFSSKKIISHIKNEKLAYNLFSFIRIVVNITLIIVLIAIWESLIKNIITFISFLSAAFAIAIRDIILNWFCGLYIKFHRPFKIEDRIEINGIKGDVIALSIFSFDILEVSNRDNFGQSTGIIINFPNSSVFTGPVKNLTKNFKYIWNEIEVFVNLDSDIKSAKQVLYKIINNIDVLKSIPRKMKNQISEISTEYRVYYNNYDPIIYTKIEGGKVVFFMRYLIHPKKVRYVNSLIWNKIYDAYKRGEIELYKKDE